MQTAVLRWPRYLLLCLQRFPRRDLSDKIDICVQYPREWERDGVRFALRAVGNHLAARAGGGGHYTAYRLHAGTWYKFNDSSVSVLDPAMLVQKNAYLLLYERLD